MTDTNLAILIFAVGLIVFIFSRTWIAIALGLVGFLALELLLGSGRIIAYLSYNSPNNFILTCLPLFIFMGEILLKAQIVPILFDGLLPLFSRLPGGLLHPAIVACSLFGAVSGSAIAAGATIGKVSFPEFESRGYNLSLSCGCVAAAGPLALIIPPSLAFIVFGLLAQVSIGKLFIGGIIPGIILTILLMITVCIVVLLRPQMAPKETPRGFKDTILALGKTLPLVSLGLAVLGSIYGGIATPTEAAAIGVAGSILLGLAYRKLTWRGFWDAVGGAVETSGIILFIFICAQVFAFAVANTGLTGHIVKVVTSFSGSPLLVLAGLLVFYLILGMFIEGGAMIAMTVPITFPIFTALGYDGVWTGVIVTFMAAVGAITPPVGVLLYVLDSISGLGLMSIAKGAAVFLIPMAIAIILMIAFPALVTWLPNLMM